jgi:chloride channel 3/4/5
VTACFAAGVEITAEWGSDLKDGYCTASWRLNKNFCCENNTRNELLKRKIPFAFLFIYIKFFFFLDGKECKEWESWSQVMQIDDSNAYMFDYLAYVVVAVCINII